MLAAPIAQTWNGDANALLPHLRTIMRAGLVIIGPAVAVAVLIGDDVVGTVLGDTFTAADADLIVAALAALTGLFVGQLALPLPLLAAFAQSRYTAVALLALVGTGVHVAASAVALSLDASCGSASLARRCAAADARSSTLLLGSCRPRPLRWPSSRARRPPSAP